MGVDCAVQAELLVDGWQNNQGPCSSSFMLLQGETIAEA